MRQAATDGCGTPEGMAVMSVAGPSATPPITPVSSGASPAIVTTTESEVSEGFFGNDGQDDDDVEDTKPEVRANVWQAGRRAGKQESQQGGSSGVYWVPNRTHRPRWLLLLSL